MFIDKCIYTSKDGKKRSRILLRHGYRENGKIKMKTIANLSGCSESEIEALKIALKEKNNLTHLKQLAQGEVQNGKFIGSLYVISQIAQEIGITKILGETQEAKRILWLITARLLEQGSRLSATRLAKNYAVGEILNMTDFCEDDLYKSLDWLYENKKQIEKKLFQHKQKKDQKDNKKTPDLFLYDVSSSYFEGTQNELAEYGYNRDKKKGKKQIVYGVMTDQEGDPVSIQAFKGNTSDSKTLEPQIKKIAEEFGCQKVTFVGDKGMIKSTGIDILQTKNFHYITTITKKQIESMIKAEVLQLSLFTEELGEIEILAEKTRYIYRKNPLRAAEMKASREDKINFLQTKINQANIYLKQHPKAKIETQAKKLQTIIKNRKMTKYATIESEEKNKIITLQIDQEAKKKEGELDGCYVIKTDLTPAESDKQTIHNRYKDLAKVEWEFRTQKTGYLDIRAIYLRKKERTVSHLFITMLAYKIERYLRDKWQKRDITVEEGLKSLGRITTYELNIGENKIIKIPEPDSELKALLDDLNLILPKALPVKPINVHTRKKLTKSR